MRSRGGRLSDVQGSQSEAQQGCFNLGKLFETIQKTKFSLIEFQYNSERVLATNSIILRATPLDIRTFSNAILRFPHPAGDKRMHAIRSFPILFPHLSQCPRLGLLSPAKPLGAQNTHAHATMS